MTLFDETEAVLDRSYYRYYTAEAANGYHHGLKYALGATALGRLVGAVGTDLNNLSDAQLAPFSDHYFEYDTQRRVTKEVASGAGCSACSGGQGEYTFAYVASSHPAGTNSWATQTTVTLPDGTQEIVFSNARGQVLLTDYRSAGLSWLNYYRYDADGRLVLQANPSAVLGYDANYADLVHEVAGNFQFVSDISGLVTTLTYGSTTTATASTPGDVVGYRSATALRQGELGTAVPQAVWQYVARSGADRTIYPVASATRYRNDDGTGAQTTQYAYTWYADTVQVESVTTTLPVVTLAQNGSGVADTSTTVFDRNGRPIWERDGAGVLTFSAYDPATGAVVQRITDVDTTQTSSFTALPSGWSTPTGGGLHLTQSWVVDRLGRTLQTIHPNGRTDYTVYNDAAHEMRFYPGWTGTTTTGPTQVVREDRWAATPKP